MASITALDRTDRAIVALLQENARLPIATLARELGLARTTVQSRIDRLEAQGMIAGYTVRLSHKMQAPIRATVLIAIEPRTGPAVLSRLKSLPPVKTVHTTSGRFDLIALIEAMDTESLDNTLDLIGEAKGVRSSESLIHLSTKLDRGG